MKACRKLRRNDSLKMQDNIIYFDTETNINTNKDGNEIQTLKLGWAIHTRNGQQPDYLFFTEHQTFWDWLYSKIDLDNQKLYVYAHNMDFDFKIVDGYNRILKDKLWSIKNMYVHGVTFILGMKRMKQEILFLDSMNYTPLPLKVLGKAVGLDKMEIDFKHCSHEQLKEYCLNDTEILKQYMEMLIGFLSVNNLTKLRNTSASLSLNAFKHRFYDYDNHPIFLHDHENVIKLERDSYRGGISDCFKIGRFKNLKLFKIDVNSMYPFTMYEKNLPTRLVHYDCDGCTLKKLKEYLKTYKVIINADVELPPDKAYILSTRKVNKINKSVFLSGEFNISVCSPEIEYILKHGKIKKVKEIALYEHYPIFTEYIRFFYDMRLKNKDNACINLFCKLMMNCLYGKVGAKKSDYEILSNEMKTSEIKEFNVISEIKTKLKNGKIKKTRKITQFLQMGSRLVKMSKSDENAEDTFVAIPSSITSYARMYLIELINASGRSNCYYADTDSLIVNEEGFNNLKPYLDDKKLGMLKLEGVSFDTTIIRPKYYDFDGEHKCKGVKKESYILNEDVIELEVAQKQFVRFKTAIKKDLYDAQYVNWVVKKMNKTYDKGIIDGQNVIPYTLKTLI